MYHPFWKFFNIFLKSTLIAGFAVSLLFNLQSVAGKGMEFRAPFFILGSFLIFFISRFKKWPTYPHAADALFTIPFVLDTYGNIFGFFDSWRFYDDLIHAINWLCFVMVFQFFNAHKFFK